MDINVDIVKLIDDERTLKAIADISIDESFVVHGLRLYEKEDGKLFVRMPSRKVTDKDGSVFNRDIIHPANSSVRSYLTEKMTAAYYEARQEAKLIED